MNIFTIMIIGFSLSMDAFSLSLAYGTLGINKKNMIKLSIIVGIYHFFMPLIGSLIGDIILRFIHLKGNFIVFMILLFIGFNLISESFKKEKKDLSLKNRDFLLFGLAVSIDSFSVGIGLETITNMHIESSLIFCFMSALFTFLGLALGKKTREIFGKIATIIGGIILVIIALRYLFYH